MSGQPCKVCAYDHRAELEADGARALKGEVSWTSVAQSHGWNHHRSVKSHMLNHWVSPEQKALDETEDELQAAIVQAEKDLLEMSAAAPPMVRPLYLTAVHNLRSLLKTQPNQQNLIAALKSAQEITGMKAQHQLLLSAGETMFAKNRDRKAAELPVEGTRKVPTVPAPTSTALVPAVQR